MRYICTAIIVLTLGCAFGCKDDQNITRPDWDGYFCEFVDSGVVCDGVVYKYGSDEFKKLWIMNHKSTYCLYKQMISNCKEYADPNLKCDFDKN